MKNSEQPITPCLMQQVGEDSFRANRHNDPKEFNRPMIGLTKREYFAAMAMQGMLASGITIDVDKDRPFQTRAQTCIMMADELLKQLEK